MSGPSENEVAPRTRFLLVEDEPALQKLYSVVLSQLDHPVDVFSTAADAIEAMKKENYAVVISDFALAGGATGRDVVRAAQDLLPQAGRMLISAFADTPMALDTIRAGEVHRILKKPFALDDLRSAVDNLALWSGLNARLSEMNPDRDRGAPATTRTSQAGASLPSPFPPTAT